MNLPIPNAAEVERFADLYETKFGIHLSAPDAYDALSRLVQFIYLTEYRDQRPLREDGWSLNRRIQRPAGHRIGNSQNRQARA